MPKIYGNTVGAGGGLPKSFLLETEDGVQLVGVTVGEETVFDATPNDVREGKTYAGEDGVKIGEKVIPSYHTTEGYKIITSGSPFNIKLDNLDKYNYTKLQAVICEFDTNLSNSVATNRVSINNSVYDVNSTDAISILFKNDDTKTIEFGITNDSEKIQILRFFTYKEIE